MKVLSILSFLMVLGFLVTGCEDVAGDDKSIPTSADSSSVDGETDVVDMDLGARHSSQDGDTIQDQGARCIILDDANLCVPGPPHNHQVGAVCANSQTPDEAYCMLSDAQTMVCARHVDGGPCQPLDRAWDAGPNQDQDLGQAANAPVDLHISTIESTDPLAAFFRKRTFVFGVPLVSGPGVSDLKLTHAATVMAEYLDNDEDGTVDDPDVVASMVRNRAILVMFASSHALEGSGIFESAVLDGFWAQDLQADETLIEGRFDATLEEVLHLISTSGYGQVYPDALGEAPGSRLTDAMDLARGGRFLEVPRQYPAGAWYHYDDRTCDYRCMATEYFYWGLTTLLGGQSSPGRCAEISAEWEVCTPNDLAVRDGDLHDLLTDQQYHLPTVLPDGDYAPSP
jgi:hypothetical protein